MKPKISKKQVLKFLKTRNNESREQPTLKFTWKHIAYSLFVEDLVIKIIKN